ncbi:MAG TPA: ATP-binding protein [Stellaceae bacterium]|nr:ATP-binding protein [Stellaceae bacterium]
MSARRRWFLHRLAGLRHPVALLVLCGALLIAAVILQCVWYLAGARQSDIDDTEQQLQNLALVLAEETDRAFQSLALVQDSLVELMRAREIASGEDLRRQMSAHDVHMMLRDKISGLPHVDAITVIDPEGNLVNFSRYWPIPKVDISDRAYFKALKDKPDLDWFVSEPVVNYGTNTRTFYLARKATGSSGQFLGLVLGAIRPEYFEGFYNNIVLGQSGAITLFRRDGIPLASFPPLDQPAEQRSADGNVIPNGTLATADQATLRITGGSDGARRILAVHALTHFPVAVAVSVAEDDALATWRREAWYFVLFATLLSVAIEGSVLLIARQFTNQDVLTRMRAQTAEAERALALAETELLRNERLSVLGQLTATVAHELRNPLSAVRNTVYAVATAARQKGLAFERQMERINRGVARCDNIIADLLEYAGTDEMKCESVPLDAWLDAALDRETLPDGVVLERRLNAPDITVSLDTERFQRAIANVIENAGQAIAESASGGSSGTIRVTTSAATEAEIVIADTGPGIAPEIMPRIFDPLFSTKTFGTGLGLATVKQTVEHLGGRIAITSELGRGTSVRMSLPLSPAVSAAVAA